MQFIRKIYLKYFKLPALSNKLKERYPDINKDLIDVYCANFRWTAPISLIDKLSKLCRNVKIRLVVEFGSGLTTLMLNKKLKEDSVLIVIEENMDYLYKTYKLMINEGVCKKIFVGNDKNIIDHKVINENIDIKNGINLVIIDGPSSDSRFSKEAEKLYLKLITEETICIVDDIDREGNDNGAKRLAENKKLVKIDYEDEIYKGHKYSILLPEKYVDLI